MVDFRSSKPHKNMTYHLQSPAGDIATFRKVSKGMMSFACGPWSRELPIIDARKVWKALLICKWQPIGEMDLLLWQNPEG